MSSHVLRIDHQQLPARVRESLIAAILDGQLRPGERLGEVALAEAMGVSRSTLREAISSLCEDGLIVSIPRRGSFVRRMTATDVHEIYSLRAALESLGGQILTERPPADEVRGRIEEIIAQMRVAAAEERSARLSELDVTFHRTLVAATGHGRLIAAWSRLNLQIMLLSRQVIDFDSVHAQTHKSADRHQVLLDAVLSGDAGRARTAIERHILDAQARLLSDLTTAGADAGPTDGAAR
jgi:DNA-binding GntR family transcriptional regulator